MLAIKVNLILGLSESTAKLCKTDKLSLQIHLDKINVEFLSASFNSTKCVWIYTEQTGAKVIVCLRNNNDLVSSCSMDSVLATGCVRTGQLFRIFCYFCIYLLQAKNRIVRFPLLLINFCKSRAGIIFPTWSTKKITPASFFRSNVVCLKGFFETFLKFFGLLARCKSNIPYMCSEVSVLLQPNTVLG